MPRGGRTSGTRAKGSGIPASGIPAGGMGWGGKPQGMPEHAPAAPAFEPGNQAAVGYHDMSRSERLAALDELKFNIAMGRETADLVRMKALESYEDRHLGKAIARNENRDVDEFSGLSDDEVAARTAQLEAAVREGAGGAAPTLAEAEFSRIRH